MALEIIAYQLETCSKSATNSAIIRAATYQQTSDVYDVKELIFNANRGTPIVLECIDGGYKFAGSDEATSIDGKIGVPALGAKDMVDKIKTVLGLNNVQIADLLKISRPSLYNHISDKESPKSMEAYQQLYSVAVLVERRVTMDIRPGLKSIIVDGKTLLEHIKSSRQDPELVAEVAVKVATKLAQSTSKRPSDPQNQRRSSRNVTRLG